MNMDAILSDLANLPIQGTGCRIAVYDQAQPGQVRRLEEVADFQEHARRICGFLVDPCLQGFARGSDILSVSVQDCMHYGYDTVKSRLVAEYGQVHIEAHAYSYPAGKATECYERQIVSIAESPTLQSLVLCSPGHDDFRVRFPATISHTLSIGLLRLDGSLLGAGLGNLLKPELLVADQPFPALDSSGSLTVVRGTSPAVMFVAGLAALLFESLSSTVTALQLKSALLLLASPCQQTYLLDRFNILYQPIFSKELPCKTSRRRKLRLRINRSTEKICRLSVAANPMSAPILGSGYRFPLHIEGIDDSSRRHVADHRLLMDFDQLANRRSLEIELNIDGLSTTAALAWTGGELEILSDEITSVKTSEQHTVIGISASHDASVVLALDGQLVTGIQLERLTRIKHDGQSLLNHDQAIQYCLQAAGLELNDVDIFAFNLQALTPGYVGLSQPLAKPDFTSFDYYGPKALFVSHHLCHALAGYSGSHFDAAAVVVADGSGGVTVGSDDLILSGEKLKTYLEHGKGSDPLKLHTFSVYEINQVSFHLKYREYANSFNVRSGSESLGEAYAAVSQFVFNSWQDSGKLMGLAPYGSARPENSVLQRSASGELNFSSSWKLIQYLAPPSYGVTHFSSLAARIQQDLEIALIDRFRRHVGTGKNLVFSGGIALNAVVNYRLREEIRPSALYLLPAQSDAGIAIGAASAAIYQTTGQIPSSLFQHDFLGYRYNERDVALAINEYANCLQVRRVTHAELAQRLINEEVFGFFSLQKGSEFGPRALGARSILADPRKRSVWTFINKWVKYREEFRPFAPMVVEECLSDYFDAEGRFPYMLEVVKVREQFRESLAAVTHVDGSARVQTVSKHDDQEIHGLLTAFHAVSGFPILLNTSFNVRGQPIVEQPRHALEMLLSTQLSGVIFGDLLVELATVPDALATNEFLGLAPGVKLCIISDASGLQCMLQANNQGKTIKLRPPMARILQALVSGSSVDEAIRQALIPQPAAYVEMLSRFCRLRLLNRLSARSNQQ
jgi:carbamoyltransferase